jgi:hypothetical protein
MLHPVMITIKERYWDFKLIRSKLLFDSKRNMGLKGWSEEDVDGELSCARAHAYLIHEVHDRVGFIFIFNTGLVLDIRSQQLF